MNPSSVPIRFLRRLPAKRRFHTSPRLQVIKQYPLADIGEGTFQYTIRKIGNTFTLLICQFSHAGITRCEIIQWFVRPGARVKEFDPLCEITSDKASAEITSRYDGVIKKLYYEADEVAIVGQPLVDIDVDEDVAVELEKLSAEESPKAEAEKSTSHESAVKEVIGMETLGKQDKDSWRKPVSRNIASNGTLATPATRHLSRELGVDISQVPGTGKDGRVMKEDVRRFASEKDQAISTTTSVPSSPAIPTQQDTIIPIKGITAIMFKTMTKSLSIPHFLYTDSVDMTSITTLRQRLNTTSAKSSSSSPKLSPLPFIIKAVSIALTTYPSINAHLDTSNPDSPVLTHKASHNFGIAIDTPTGLVVPVLRNIQSLSITEIAFELARLSELARNSKLSSADLAGATFTISNIGSIGGGAVAPVIVGPQVAILGVGRAKAVPAFGEQGQVVRREEAVFSWSADHRVVDGAGLARCADVVRGLLERVEEMVIRMR